MEVREHLEDLLKELFPDAKLRFTATSVTIIADYLEGGELLCDLVMLHATGWSISTDGDNVVMVIKFEKGV